VLKKVSQEEDRSNFSAVTLADIDRTMKKYSDNLLHALEGVSSRLSQMEGTTRQLENSVDELKLTVGNYNGSTDGKLRHLENMLREVSLFSFPLSLPLLYNALPYRCDHCHIGQIFCNGRTPFIIVWMSIPITSWSNYHAP
jgi:hypothetical protein